MPLKVPALLFIYAGALRVVSAPVCSRQERDFDLTSRNYII
jgi:hypothetical protein